MVEEQEEREGTSEAQLIEGYGCICGFGTEDMHEFRNHLLHSSGRDGKGTHKSVGRINMQTGEVLMGPWARRTKAERKSSSHAKRKRKKEEGIEDWIEKEGIEEGIGKEDKKKTIIRTTDVLADATQVRVIPRVYTMNYTPIMMSGLCAAVEFWGWPKDITLEDFLDTALHMLFKEHGIHLAGYSITDEARKSIEVEKQEVAG